MRCSEHPGFHALGVFGIAVSLDKAIWDAARTFKADLYLGTIAAVLDFKGGKRALNDYIMVFSPLSSCGV
ncbi:hypothetical protein ACYULU_05935 [Breznakiellaceae bacterium SP9]